MRYSKSLTVLLALPVCAMVFADTAAAQGRARGGGRSGGGRGPTVGRAVPRAGGGPGRIIVRGDRGRSYGSRISPRVVVGAPLRSYYYPYYGGYGYGYPYRRYGVSIGLYRGWGYPYGYGYGYPYYGYPYGYSYGGYYPAGYGYGGYYGYRGGAGFGAVRIEGAVRDAEVLVDGYYAGIVDDFDGAFQRIELESGTHEIEIRAQGFPPLTYDVNVQPGQTLTLHANVR